MYTIYFLFSSYDLNKLLISPEKLNLHCNKGIAIPSGSNLTRNNCIRNYEIEIYSF